MMDEIETKALLDRLAEIIDYDPISGVMRWKRKEGDDWQSMIWNTKNPGKSIGFPDKDGYLQIKIKVLGKNRHLKLHRVAWLIFYGQWPSGCIDHIDHNKTNNAIANLRSVDRASNQRNLPLRRNSSSGYTGVSWHKGKKAWRARITVGGKELMLGYFDCAKAASAVVQVAKIENGYHRNHGL
jgi:hypothetical protein